MNFSIKDELKKIILNSNQFFLTFSKNHTNSKYSIDLIIDELLYFLKSGLSWRMLRSTINFKTLYSYYSKFVKNNIFYKLFNLIKNKYLQNYQNNVFYIDSTIICNKYGSNKLGRNKFYKNKRSTKISLMTDSTGFPLSIFFIKGNYHDNSIFQKHINDAIIILPNKTKTIIADKAYSSNDNYSLLEKNNLKHIIPPRKNMKIYKTYIYDKNEYKKRIKIEHIFGRLKMFRHLILRYDRLLRNFAGFVFFAMSVIALNIFKDINTYNI